MKLCNNCGTPLKDTDAFCRKCGQKMGGKFPCTYDTTNYRNQ